MIIIFFSFYAEPAAAIFKEYKNTNCFRWPPSQIIHFFVDSRNPMWYSMRVVQSSHLSTPLDWRGFLYFCQGSLYHTFPKNATFVLIAFAISFCFYGALLQPRYQNRPATRLSGRTVFSQHNLATKRSLFHLPNWQKLHRPYTIADKI